MQNAQDLFEHELRDIYDAEQKLVRATETMASKVSDQSLSSAFTEHTEVTKGQIKRLEGVFSSIGREPRREKCPGINGLIEEFSSFVQEKPAEEVLDLFAAGAGAKAEHYEINSYKSLIALAGAIGVDPSPLKENLTEEQDMASRLESLSPELVQRVPVGAGSA